MTLLTLPRPSQRRDDALAPAPEPHGRRRRRRRLGAALPLAVLGFLIVLGAWYLTVELLALPRFRALPGPTEVAAEWFAPDPSYGTSVFTPVYYDHILASVRRVGIAFLAALVTGIPLGLAARLVDPGPALRLPGLRADPPDPDPGLGAPGDPHVPHQ